MKNHAFFTSQLLKWDKSENFRVMPWKGEGDPYKIWLSEIILQQTRVSQGLEYYNRFISAYPDITILAKAKDEDIYKLWEGLGYYSRCKNMVYTARYITEKLEGKFPDNYDNILNLKGVGPYTASAIASFAFKIPRAVLDGNVFRVLSRFFGIKDPIDSSKGKAIFEKLATELLDKTDPGRYNQSIMDFGALICKPKQPRCEECRLREKCVAYKNDIVHLLPVKEKRIEQKERWFVYLIISEGGEFYIRQRPKGDIWENLHEFVMIECYSEDELLNIKKDVRFSSLFRESGYKVTGQTSLYRQKLTHQTINSIFISVDAKTVLLPPGYFKVNEKAMNRLAFPKVITTFLADKNVSLNLTKGV